MKFHSLKMQAFGPYRGAESIDFGKLNAARLFLIAGRTGAGKSTMLDAICFALYGQTTGEGQGAGATDGRKGVELRSRGAADDIPTEVTLRFEVADVRYRIERRPAQTRAAQRGGGTTDAPAVAKLFRIDANTAPGSGAVEELIAHGPQGVNPRVEEITGFTADQFRRVVLIPQGRFREVLVSDAGAREELLKRIFRTQRYERFEEIVDTRAKEERRGVEELEAQRKSLLGDEEWARDLSSEKVEVRLEKAVKEAVAEATRCADAAAKASRERDAAVAAFEQARATEDLFISLDQALKDRDRRKADVERLEPERRERDAARRAAEPMRCLKALRKRRAAVERDEKEVPSREEGLEKARRAFDEASSAFDKAKEEAKRIPALGERIGALRAELAELDKAKGRRTSAEKEVEEAEKVLERHQEKLAEASRTLEQATKALRIAEERHRDAQRRHAEGVSARLAQTLSEGSECPVCGACEHPRPAQPPSDLPDETEVEALRIAEEDARRHHESARTRRTKVDGEVQRTQGRLDAARQALAQLEEIGDDGRTGAELSTAETESTALTDALETATRARDRAADKHNQAGEALRAAARNLSQAREELEDARSEYEQAVEGSSLTTEDEVEANARDESRVAMLSEKLEQADSGLKTAEGAVEACRRQVEGRTRVDLGPVERRAVQARTASETCEQERSHADREKLRLEALARRHGECRKALAGAETKLRVVEKLAELVHGRGRISFHRWVLGSVLEEVLAEGSDVLRSISGERYRLLRSSGQGVDGRARIGLDIEVFDTHDNARRPARTLSGGETFVASLSLALALARTTERRGGRRIDTLFIDEGFGSLDQSTLDEVMAALRRLSDEGRVIGVISHVEEMKRVIPASLEVLPSRDGAGASVRLRGVD